MGESEVNQNQPKPAIVRQKDIKDLDGTSRRCWCFTWSGQLYSLAEPADEPVILVDHRPEGWAYVPEDQRDEVLEAFRAELDELPTQGTIDNGTKL